MRSTTANRVDDFYAVIVVESEVIVLAAWHDFAVDFNSDAFADQVQHLQQLTKTGIRFQ